MFTPSLQLLTQRTVTNRLCASCKPYEQYQVNAQGNKHGYYKAWDRQGRQVKQYGYLNGELHGTCLIYFGNGMIKEASTYHEGVQTSLKVYAYENNKRKLIRNATWDKSGNVLTDGGNVGLLPNGRWRFHYPKYGDYSETYNGNDTLYIWDDRGKVRFLGKRIEGVFIEYKSQLDIELAKRESIRSTTVYTRDMLDSLLTISEKYINALSIHYGTGDNNMYNSNELQFYELLYKELKTSKDTHLVSLIIDALGLQCISETHTLDLQCRSENKWQASIYIISGNSAKPLIRSCNNYYSRLHTGRDYGSKKTYTQAKLLK